MIKRKIKLILSLFFKFYSRIFWFSYKNSNNNISFPKVFYKSRLFYKGNYNVFKWTGSIENSKIEIIGNRNSIKGINTKLNNSNILIIGQDNEVKIMDNAVINDGKIIIRGRNCHITINENSGFGGVRIVNVGKDNVIEIGKNCVFADNIEIWSSDTHAIYDSNNLFINPELPIHIGDNVWVCSHVKILKGVNIGNNSVIGMGSIVTKDVKSNSLNAGIPLKEIKNNIYWTLYYPNEQS